MNTVGIVGLGAMGGGVADTLHKKGYQLWCYDINRTRFLEKECETFHLVDAPTQLAAHCDAIFLFLPMAPFDPALEDLLVGNIKLLDHMQEGSVIVECGNTSPEFTKQMAAQAELRHVGYVDAPASGGSAGAQTGTLSIMAGGSQDAFQKVRPILEDISSELHYFGTAGMGQTAKLINNMLVNGQLALLSEVMVFAKKCNLNLDELFQTLSKGAAASWVLQTYGSGILNRPYQGSETPGGGFSGVRRGGRDKQLAWAVQMSDELETPLPITSAAYQMFMMARGAGKNGLFEPIVELLEEMTNVFVCGNAVSSKEKIKN